MKMIPSALFRFLVSYAVNMVMLLFGVALYIASAATVGLAVPAYVDVSLLSLFTLAITVAEYSGRSILALVEKLANAKRPPVPVSDNPGA